MEPPFRPRQFVWCRFPFIEDPLRPGPKERVGYIADIRRIEGQAHFTVMSLYTTTTPWEDGAPLPLGIIPVETDSAKAMNQKGFVLDARRITFMPANQAFFPRLSRPDHGVIHTATREWHHMVQDALLSLAKRQDLVVKLGPDAPNQGRSR